MFQPFTNIGTIGHVGTITNKADSAHYTYMDPPRFAKRFHNGHEVMTAHLHSASGWSERITPGPDGNRALAPYLLGVAARGAGRV